MNIPGKLFVVATPIGNLEDITLRALRILKEVDLIAAEDTRQTRKLLTHFQTSKPLLSYFEHNEETRKDRIIEMLKDGKNVALVSDAGTPGISDPGFTLVRKCVEENLEIIPVPGPSAFTAALSIGGLPTDSFVFIGFLSRKSGARKHQLERLKAETRTLIFYESPYRVIDSLKDMLGVLGDRKAVVCRELTKQYEEIKRDNLSRLHGFFSQKKPLGEFCILVAGAEK